MLNAKDGGRMLLRNVGNYILVDGA